MLCCCAVGSLWQPNITVSNISVNTRAALCVSFSPDTHCEEYLVIVQCSRIPQVQRIYKVSSHETRGFKYLCNRLSHSEDE